MVNYCTYCAYEERAQFLNLVNNYSCPYYWKHDPLYGQDGNNKVENPTLLTTLHGTYPLRRNIPVNNSTDFLKLTAERIVTRGDVGERDRNEYPYLVYCSSKNMYGVKCDSYVWSLSQYRFGGHIIVNTIFRIILIIIVVVVVLYPRVIFFRRTSYTLYINKPAYKKFFYFIYRFTTDMKNQCCVFMIFSIFFIILEDCRDLSHTPYSYFTTGGLWRSISLMCVIVSLGSLMILWSHVYHSANAMDGGENFNLWNKLLVAFFYSSLGAAVLTVIILQSIQNTFKKYGNYLYMYVTVIGYIFILILGFLIYGFRMYYMLKKSSDNVRFHKLKFTKFMMLILLLFMHLMFWMIIDMLHYTPLEGTMGIFMDLCRSQILDLSSVIMVPFVSYMIFESHKFWIVQPFKYMHENFKIYIKTNKDDTSIIGAEQEAYGVSDYSSLSDDLHSS
ncbi:hypothetical protein AKO1_008266 [Acrasis kona]|uniref:Serpentine receptor class gamma n=1 Tax=Acrasis kona TaxID=1008807 RepID=A0AAW2YNP7_9EUKA